MWEAPPMEYIAFDAHKHYTLASVVTPDGQLVREERIEHDRGTLREFLERCERGSPVAVETIGNWYWIIDEIEAAGCMPRLVHARKAKLMMGEINKTDKLDARGLNRLQRSGTLPTVWIPPGEVRDQRDLPRTRMVLVRQRTQLKNRIREPDARRPSRASWGERAANATVVRHLVDAIKRGQATETLLAELAVEEARAKAIEQELAALDARPRLVALDRKQMAARLHVLGRTLRGALAAGGPQARRLIQGALGDRRITCVPFREPGRRGYRFRATGTYGALMSPNIGGPNGIRTRVSALRGRLLRSY